MYRKSVRYVSLGVLKCHSLHIDQHGTRQQDKLDRWCVGCMRVHARTPDPEP